MASLFEIVNSGADPRESLRLYREEQQRLEQRRRRLFQPFGVDPESGAPASTVFHDHSRLFHDTVLPLSADGVRELTCALDYKRYPEAPRVALDASARAPQAGLEEVLAARRSVREFGAAPVPAGFLSACLKLGCGLTDSGATPPRRAAPSGGALYPIEIYPVVLGVSGVEPGLYHYDVLAHELERIRGVGGPEELWPVFSQGLWGVTPSLALMMSARLPRVQKKYGERGYRFALLECGHIAQNFLLLGAAAGLSAVALGGFVDDEMNRFLGIDGKEEVGLYAVLVGSPVHPDTEGAPKGE